MRAFGCFVAIILLAGLIGALLAYPAFELATGLGASWAFHRVAGRIAMLVLLLELIGLCRYLGLRRARDLGYGLPWRRFVAQAGLWWCIGMATAAVGAAFLMGTGLRVVDPAFLPSAAGLAALALTALASGLAVALLEETVMRGAMHTAIERESGAWAAALLTAPLFAVLHFFAKVRIPPDQIGWLSGFALLARSFEPLSQVSLVLDSFLSWLAVGLLLSLTRALTGNIAVALGLHAGWVVVLRLLQLTTLRGTSPGYSGWVGRFDGLLGYWLLPWAAAVAAGLWFSRGLWVPYAGREASTGASGASTSSR